MRTATFYTSLAVFGITIATAAADLPQIAIPTICINLALAFCTLAQETKATNAKQTQPSTTQKPNPK